MRKLRILLLCHRDLVPPDSLEGLPEKEIQVFKKEYDVMVGLQELGHEVDVLGVADDLVPIRQRLLEMRPHAVFVLLMEFQDVAIYQVHVTSYLELLRAPYAGCNPRGLLLAKDKALSKKIFRYHRIPTPSFRVFRRDRRVRSELRLRYPLIVKSVAEEASRGISQASVVQNEAALRERVAFVHANVAADAIAEQYIEGRELTIGVLGNERLTTFPVWELYFDKLPPRSEPIATERVKWDLEYQKRIGVRVGPARELPGSIEHRIAQLARRVFRALSLSGYARVDLRLTPAGRIFVLEANPNPDLSEDEDFALSAKAMGIDYPQLLQRIVNLGQAYRAPWKQAS